MLNTEFFPYFNDISAEFAHCDYHLHSNWSDGLNSIEEIVQKSINMGLTSIAITDHMRESSIYFDDYLYAIRNFNTDNLKIYCGFEAKIKNFSGDIDVKQEVVTRADIAVASVHRFPIKGELYTSADVGCKSSQDIEFELSMNAISRGGFNVLGHPGGMSISKFSTFDRYYFEEIIKACKKNNIAFDFNGRYHINHVEILVELLRVYNPRVSIGSDSHDIKYLGLWNNKLKDYL